MNVAVIGSGGREHAIALKISDSKLLNRLFIIPGNPGTKSAGKNININADDHQSIIEFCKENKIDLVVVGPEKPLVDGLADKLRLNSINVFGPDALAAEIEAHKIFAKQLLTDNHIPTARAAKFSSKEFNQAEKYLADSVYPCVIKADGLAAGKGVIICSTFNQAYAALDSIFKKRIFGSAGDNILIEEFMTGEEASVFAITDGKEFICLPAAQDHKRIGDNDSGKNTGGMGAYAPAPIVTPELMTQIENLIIKPTLKALDSIGRKFIGCLYAGLMLTDEGAKVVEFNCRFGDPETQVVLPLLEGDFLQLLFSAAIGELDKTSVKYNGGCSVCVVASSKGYPDSYEKGFIIKGLESKIDDVIIYHAGTKEVDGNILTDGGRVLGITSVLKTNDLKTAKLKAYEALNKIHFDGMYFRKDISDKAFSHI
ncbi:MAG: phosphoribosylamine--glycine ligase [Ignavibacteriaceae bacterium]|nr:phosphoribosylamine--glycine ligase [Ignavibacteriaceae bacterium]